MFQLAKSDLNTLRERGRGRELQRGKWRQEGREFQASLDYIIRPCFKERGEGKSKAGQGGKEGRRNGGERKEKKENKSPGWGSKNKEKNECQL